MKYLAIAAVSATFWLAVATLHLILHPVPRVVHVGTAPIVAPRIEPVPAAPPDDFCSSDRLRAVSGNDRLSFWNGIRCGLRAAKPKIDACFPEHPVTQHFKVRVLLGKSGRVLSAVTDERLADTPIGPCIARAVKSVRYPPTDSRMSFVFAYMGE
jgi:hypothetical protein